MKMNRINLSLFIFILGLFVWLVVAPLMKDGMFSDGVGYASVARNLSLGIGTYWEPHFSDSLFNQFHNHPPLMIWLQSFFFQMLGDSIYPERFYCILCGVVLLLLIADCWKKINKDSTVKEMIWLPQLLWIITPTVSWGLRNNVIENTMVIFDFLSVLFMLKLFENKHNIASFLLASVFLFAASFTKGFQGLFPLAVPFCYWVSTKKISFKRMLILTIAFTVFTAITYFILMQLPAALQSYKEYFAVRLHGFPHTPTANVENRLWLLCRIGIELSVAVIVWLFLILMTNGKGSFKIIKQMRAQQSLFFFLVALTASLPLMISYEQRGFYLITSIPFFSISIACVTAEAIKSSWENWRRNFRYTRLISSIVILFFLSGIVYSYLTAGIIGRDNEKLHDVYLLKNVIGSGQTVAVTNNTWSDWALQSYFQRYDNISLSFDSNSSKFFLQPIKDGTINLPNYHELNLQTEYLIVYAK